jgi:MFS family permease
VVFLTLYIDLVGFSIIFPLFPAMLNHYLAVDGQSGLLGAVVRSLEGLSGLAGAGAGFTIVLFGGFLGSLYSFLQFFFAPFWGGLSDRYGRRPILLFTVLGTAVSYGLWFFSGSFLLLVLARLFGGAMSGNLSVATAAVADITSKENRAKGMGLIGVAFGLGFVTGPAIGGISAELNLLDHFPGLATIGVNPFSVPALVACLLATANFIWIATRFRESLPPERRIHTGAVASRNPIKALRAPLEPPARRTNRVYFLFILAFAGMEFTLAFLAVERFDATTRDITWMMVFVGLVLIATQGGIVRRLVPRLGEQRSATIGLSLVAAGFLVLALAQAWTPLYLGLLLLGVGAGLTTPSLTSLVSLYASESKQGQTLGAFRSLGSLARAFGPILASFLFFWFGSGVSYACGAALMLVPMALAWRLPQPPK